MRRDWCWPSRSPRESRPSAIMCTVCGRTADFSAINVHSRFIFGKYPYFRYLIVPEARSAGLGRLTSGHPMEPTDDGNQRHFIFAEELPGLAEPARTQYRPAGLL